MYERWQEATLDVLGRSSHVDGDDVVRALWPELPTFGWTVLAVAVLDEMCDQGLVDARGRGRSRCWTVTPLGRAEASRSRTLPRSWHGAVTARHDRTVLEALGRSDRVGVHAVTRAAWPAGREGPRTLWALATLSDMARKGLVELDEDGYEGWSLTAAGRVELSRLRDDVDVPIACAVPVTGEPGRHPRARPRPE